MMEKGAVPMTVAATEAGAIAAGSDLPPQMHGTHGAIIGSAMRTESEKRQHALYQDWKRCPLKDWQQSQADQATAQAALANRETPPIAARGKLQILILVKRQIRKLEQAAATVEAAIFPTRRSCWPPYPVRSPNAWWGQASSQAGSSSPVFAIGNFGRLWLPGQCPRGRCATQMRPGEAVDVTADLAMPGRSYFPAKLDPGSSSASSTLPRIDWPCAPKFDNPDGKLKPAMFATMLVHTGGDRVICG